MSLYKTPEQLIQEAEQEILNPQHSFDMVIPGEIRVITSLSWNEKMLYGLIRNLCRKEGYCWATNEYLANEMDISVSTIKRWIDNLIQHGALTREVINHKMHNRRRLWITDMYEKFKKSLISSSVNPQSVHGRAGDGCMDEPELKRYIYTKENLLPLTPSKPEPEQDLPPTKEEEEEIEKRFRERPKGSKKILSRDAWNSKVLKDLRKESSKQEDIKKMALKHKSEASLYDMTIRKGMTVCVCKDWVELTQGSYVKEVRYDIPDDEWYKHTGFNENTKL